MRVSLTSLGWQCHSPSEHSLILFPLRRWAFPTDEAAWGPHLRVAAVGTLLCQKGEGLPPGTVGPFLTTPLMAFYAVLLWLQACVPTYLVLRTVPHPHSVISAGSHGCLFKESTALGNTDPEPQSSRSRSNASSCGAAYPPPFQYFTQTGKAQKLILHFFVYSLGAWSWVLKPRTLFFHSSGGWIRDPVDAFSPEIISLTHSLFFLDGLLSLLLLLVNSPGLFGEDLAIVIPPEPEFPSKAPCPNTIASYGSESWGHKPRIWRWGGGIQFHT